MSSVYQLCTVARLSQNILIMVPSYPIYPPLPSPPLLPLRPPPALFHLFPRSTPKGTNINPGPGCPPPRRRYIQAGCICQRGPRADLGSINCRHHGSRYNEPGNACDAQHTPSRFFLRAKSLMRTLCDAGGIKSQRAAAEVARQCTESLGHEHAECV